MVNVTTLAAEKISRRCSFSPVVITAVHSPSSFPTTTVNPESVYVLVPASFSSTRIVVAATKELAGFTTSPDWRAGSNAGQFTLHPHPATPAHPN